MAYLINRNPAARFECLYSLVKLINAKYGHSRSFSLNDVKYNPDVDNVHNYCTLLQVSEFGVNYCPYLQNPLSEAGCNMTNGVELDSTKSKEVSNTVNALHALGFVKRSDRSVTLTQTGLAFARAVYGTQEMQDIISSAVVNYGPVVGVLNQISQLCALNGKFDTSDITVGYPNSNETVSYKGNNVTISSGSQDDSNTRTKSCILAWLTAGGYIRPAALEPLQPGEYAHEKYKNFINQPHRGDRKYIFTKEPPFVNNSSFKTGAPLDYKNLTKLTGALRENGQASEREATMKYEPRIQNRRLAIIFLLNKAFMQNKTLSFQRLVQILSSKPDLFVVSQSALSSVIREEIKIADMAGIPFNIVSGPNGVELKPIGGVNTNELTLNAPQTVLDYLKSVTI